MGSALPTYLTLGHTYLIAARQRPAGAQGAIQSVRQVTVVRGGRPGTVTPVFTARPPAVRFVGRLADAADLTLLGVRTPNTLAVVLAHLLECGESHVLFDPEPAPDLRRLVDIPRVIRAIVGHHRRVTDG